MFASMFFNICNEPLNIYSLLYFPFLFSLMMSVCMQKPGENWIWKDSLHNVSAIIHFCIVPKRWGYLGKEVIFPHFSTQNRRGPLLPRSEAKPS